MTGKGNKRNKRTKNKPENVTITEGYTEFARTLFEPIKYMLATYNPNAFYLVNKENLKDIIHLLPRDIQAKYADVILEKMKEYKGMFPVGYIDVNKLVSIILNTISKIYLKSVPEILKKALSPYIKKQEEIEKMVESIMAYIRNENKISPLNIEELYNYIDKAIDKKLEGKVDKKEVKRVVHEEMTKMKNTLPQLVKEVVENVLQDQYKTDGGEYTQLYRDLAGVVGEEMAKEIVQRKAEAEAFEASKKMFGEDNARELELYKRLPEEIRREFDLPEILTFRETYKNLKGVFGEKMAKEIMKEALPPKYKKLFGYRLEEFLERHENLKRIYDVYLISEDIVRGAANKVKKVGKISAPSVPNVGISLPKYQQNNN